MNIDDDDLSAVGPDRSPTSWTLARRPLSMRRTTAHVCARPNGIDGPVSVSASGRDARTTAGGTIVEADRALVEIEADFFTGLIGRLTTDTDLTGADELSGVSAYSGFRNRVQAALGGATDSLLYQLFDDIPMALLLSGRVPREHGIGLGNPDRPPPVDICAGWAEGGAALQAYSPTFGPPLSVGPVAPRLDAEDSDGWHDHKPSQPHTTARRRLIDVWIDEGDARVMSLFCDSHVDGTLKERVVHEYRIDATVDLASRAVRQIAATPGPLPFPECPSAAASVQRTVGTTLDDVRILVSETFTGPSTCTHLNDATRALDGVGALVRALVSQSSQTMEGTS